MHALAAPSPTRRTLLATLLCLSTTLALAQAAGSDYTVDLPSVDRVKAEIKGSDPTDSLARQCAVFNYLYTYVDRIKYNRTVRGPYTSGESRVMTAYRLAAYQMSQDYAKTHTADEAKAFERLHGQYEMNSDFYNDWSKRLIGPQTAAAYKGAEQGLATTQRAHVAQEQQQYQKDVAAQSAAPNMSNDPTAVATRRCLELGGDSTACVGKSFVGGLMSMVGFGSESMSALTGPSRTGIVLSGNYRGPATSVSFGTDSVDIQHCADLVEASAPYSIRKSPAGTQIVLQTEPHSITLAMHPDGSLVGPGLVDVTGKIIIGYHTVTSTQMINGSRAAPDQCNGPCQTVSRVPDFGPKTVRCSIASYTPPAPAPPAAAASADSGIFGALTGMLGTISPTSEPGLRIVGKFTSSSGLILDFAGDAVTLDCGPAHVKQPYTVENAPSQFLVHVNNNGGLFILALASDNTLRGSGATTVNGRLVSGMNGDNITYTPKSQQCGIATLTPASANSSTTIAAGASTALPPPAVPTSAPSAAATSSPAAPSTRAALRVIITSTAGATIAANQQVIIMRERIDEVLRKLDLPIPPNTTPGKAVQLLAETCRTRDCSVATAGLKPYYVTAVKLDATGKAILSATTTTGPYFIYSVVRTPAGAYVWDLPVNFAAGDNNITLTTANAELIQ